jgi:hypothetical protein
MLHVIQLLLPLYIHDHPTTPADDLHAMVQAELTRHYGRCVSHTRSPSGGRWLSGRLGRRDEIVIYEVMSRLLDARWWDWYQEVLEVRFRQEQVVIRALPLMSL